MNAPDLVQDLYTEGHFLSYDMFFKKPLTLHKFMKYYNRIYWQGSDDGHQADYVIHDTMLLDIPPISGLPVNNYMGWLV